MAPVSQSGPKGQEVEVTGKKAEEPASQSDGGRWPGQDGLLGSSH